MCLGFVQRFSHAAHVFLDGIGKASRRNGIPTEVMLRHERIIPRIDNCPLHEFGGARMPNRLKDWADFHALAHALNPSNVHHEQREQDEQQQQREADAVPANMHVCTPVRPPAIIRPAEATCG